MSTLVSGVRISNAKYRLYTNGSTVYCIDRFGVITYDTDWGNLLNSLSMSNGVIVFDEGIYPANTAEWAPTGIGVASPGRNQLYVVGAGSDETYGTRLICGAGKRACVPAGGIGLHLSDMAIQGATTGAPVNIIDGQDTEAGYYDRCSILKGSLERLKIYGGVSGGWGMWLKNPEWTIINDVEFGMGVPVWGVNGICFEESVNAGAPFGTVSIGNLMVACDGPATNFSTISNHASYPLNNIHTHGELWLRNANAAGGSVGMHLEKIHNSTFDFIHFENMEWGLYLHNGAYDNVFRFGESYSYAKNGGMCINCNGYNNTFKDIFFYGANFVDCVWFYDGTNDANQYNSIDNATLYLSGGKFSQTLQASTHFFGGRKARGAGTFPAGFPT